MEQQCDDIVRIKPKGPAEKTFVVATLSMRIFAYPGLCGD
jgi:hypothetical protein